MNDNAATPPNGQPRFLMCPPRHFAVTYSINPWMNPKNWAQANGALSTAAGRQWSALQATLESRGAAVEFVAPEPDLPDLVFTANAAIVLDRKAMLARFRHSERQREEPFFAATFQALHARGLIDRVVRMPDDLTLEGAGDCLWDQRRGLFWMGYGPRSDLRARQVIEDEFGVGCVALELADASYYHMDTALCTLPSGEVMYYPDAFTANGRAAIAERVTPEQRIEIDRADAVQFAANAVCVDHCIVLSSCTDVLRRRLEERGYAVVATPLHAFLRSGGSACCLTLRLDLQSARAN
jgi:N-dimethylarginine dimethylaminohydrolase